MSCGSRRTLLTGRPLLLYPMVLVVILYTKVDIAEPEAMSLLQMMDLDRDGAVSVDDFMVRLFTQILIENSNPAAYGDTCPCKLLEEEVKISTGVSFPHQTPGNTFFFLSLFLMVFVVLVRASRSTVIKAS